MSLKKLIQIGFLVLLELSIDWLTVVFSRRKTYQEKYKRYSQEYKELEQKLETLTNSLQKKKSQAKSIKEFIQHLSNRDLVSEFDEKLWYTMVEKVIIASKEEVDFHFKNGVVISI